jgi:hypothetical protein
MPEDIQKAVESALDNMGINKADPGMITSGNSNFDGVLPKEVTMRIITQMPKADPFLGAVTMEPVKSTRGNILLMNMNGIVCEGITEEDDRLITNKPNTWNVPFQLKDLKANVIIKKKALESYATLENGESFEDKVMNLTTNLIAHNVAHLAMNGDTSLPGDSRENRLLNQCNGVLKQAEGGQVYDAEGKAYGEGMFNVMEDMMLEDFYNEESIKWIYNRKMKAAWKLGLQMERATGIGDQYVVGQPTSSPLGLDELITGKISKNMGPSAAPDDATDDTTKITFNINGLIGTTTKAGRKVKVTCLTTGKSEICTVKWSDPNNYIETATLLGQDTVSETASDYLVKINDETASLFTDPKGVIIPVSQTSWEAYRDWNTQLRGWIITLYFSLDVVVAEPEAIVLMKRISLPQINDWKELTYPAA